MKFLFFLFPLTLFCQTNLSVKKLNDSIELAIQYRDGEKAKKLIDMLSSKDLSSFEDRFLLNKNIFFYHFIQKEFDSCQQQILTINRYKQKLSERTKAKHNVNIAFLKSSQNKIDSSAIYFVKALNFYEKDSTEYLDKKTTIYSGLYSLYRRIGNKEKELIYLKLYVKESKKNKSKRSIAYSLNSLAVFYDNNNEPKKALKNFREALTYIESEIGAQAIYQNIGSIYLNHYNNIDSAYYYNKKAINQNTSKRTLAHIHYDLSIIAKRKNDLLLENNELQKALKNIKLDPFQELEVKIYKDLSENTKKLKNYKESLLYLEKYDSLNNVIKNQSLIEKVEDIEIKYQTEKKERENLQLKVDKEKNKSYLIVSVLSLVLISIIGTLTLQNSKRKRKVLEQQKELEKQKNLTLIKEQEITTINAMVDGQEKERKQIAEDLHDNLGSVLATLKLHFDNLKINREKKKINQDELFNKTEKLIDDAYLKVRSIAHAKNAGVIANKGLLVAVKMMAEKISSADSIKIEVVDFNLVKRLENNLEITVFRIIQELMTNIIKHANAKNVTINISLFDKNLNIIVEDDGVGFDINTVELNDGMGIHSIKTRIQYLKGTFTIDTTLGKGSSIIMDIPIL
ncbi:sensor histidine kinase [Polaribacter litorisediminis]|uniref:sensor histidine kinase n=1 Tax=Polaribacter litorisediminis TaxID=1908341 RepID=UPI001CC0EB93|nr:sensor histidine kinase [Polaribacter litorisediminis]UAM99837.1 sensor histidine kinase [Polaribacter litorisediminis]